MCCIRNCCYDYSLIVESLCLEFWAQRIKKFAHWCKAEQALIIWIAMAFVSALLYCSYSAWSKSFSSMIFWQYLQRAILLYFTVCYYGNKNIFSSAFQLKILVFLTNAEPHSTCGAGQCFTSGSDKIMRAKWLSKVTDNTLLGGEFIALGVSLCYNCSCGAPFFH